MAPTKLTSGLLLIAVSLGISASGCNRLKSTSESQSAATHTQPDRSEILLTGSSTVAPLVLEIAQRFESQHPGIKIDVQTGGSGQGITDTRSGIADIGMASRPLKSDEQDMTAKLIARDGVGLIIHKANLIKQLTRQQIIDIYQDRIQNWSELGGPDQAIIVVHKAEGRATLEVFLEHFKIENPSVHADVIVGENEHAIKTVAGSPGAIGYVSIGTAEAGITLGEPIQLLPLDAVEATTENVANGTYPMTRPLNLVIAANPSKLVSEFIAYCQSSDVHDLVKAQFFVPVSP